MAPRRSPEASEVFVDPPRQLVDRWTNFVVLIDTLTMLSRFSQKSWIVAENADARLPHRERIPMKEVALFDGCLLDSGDRSSSVRGVILFVPRVDRLRYDFVE